jgi:hypothetical protein
MVSMVVAVCPLFPPATFVRPHDPAKPARYADNVRRLLDEPDELVTWARAALAAARRVAAKRERTAPRRKSKPQPKW